MADVAGLLAQIRSTTDLVRKKKLALADGDRNALLAASQELTAALETPLHAVHKLVFAPAGTAAARIATEMGIFDAVEPGATVTTGELAEKTKADAVLIRRVVRVLVTLHFFQQPAADTFVATDKVVALRTTAPWNQTLIHFSEVHNPILAKLPLYLAARGFANPEDALHGAFQEVWGTKLHYFEWLKQNPRQHKALNTLVKAQRQGMGSDWFDFFPAAERLQAHGSDNPSPVLVDVGGGSGADVAAFLRRFPESKGRIVLQDLPEVLAGSTDLVDGIDAAPHDFFTPQPVRGAAMYYMRTVLHDWPDADARRILGSIRSAMGANSVLLVNEFVMPDTNPPFVASSLDMSMMALFSSQERTRAQWTGLLSDAGFDVVDVWFPSSAARQGAVGLIEARARA